MAGEVIKMVPSALFNAAFQLLLANQDCLFPVLSFIVAAVHSGEEECEPNTAFPEESCFKAPSPSVCIMGKELQESQE